MKVDITDWQTRQLKDTEMAAIYGISRSTVWRWCNEGRIPKPRKIGGNTTRWDGQEVAKNMEVTT